MQNMQITGSHSHIFLGFESFCRNVIYISEHELEASWTWSLWMDNKDSHTLVWCSSPDWSAQVGGAVCGIIFIYFYFGLTFQVML